MNKHVLSVLVVNHSGVLSRISGLFSRRGFNIDSLTVGETKNPEFSRMTIVVTADDEVLEQVKKQLNKLVDVKKIIEVKANRAVYREIALIKVSANDENRPSIIGIIDIFRAKIVDVANESLIVEITGDEEKIEALLNLLKPYGIKEVARTGLTALERGNKQLDQYDKFEEE